MKIRFIILVFSIFILRFVQPVLADSEAPPRPHIKSSENGMYYAKSVPEGFDRTKGRTYIYQVGAMEDTLLHTYNWYAQEVYLLNNTLVRMGPWARGQEASKDDFAIGFYSNGQPIKEYSTLDIVNLAYNDPKTIQVSISHYTILKEIVGFKWSGHIRYSFEVKTHEDKVISFNIETGKLRTEEDKKHDRLLDAVGHTKGSCYETYSEKTSQTQEEFVLSEEDFRECANERNSYIPPTPKGYKLYLGTKYEQPRLENK